ncbi:MAG: ABC transporter ATP-binding protein [Desulfobacteraceae bacterium]|nr:ABC transporter ATP-binding protein [Desulfobacteraceae bacterium]MDH3573859.1 ABC transporter ATP-binding protein [Desulfobacteraceae bacterium]MDH3837268.1 ABC transporter ATP-binding protein [Desulfobacteraceae bacterium]MDH3874989.1 ABC transporter ATP-binding protein [Desulfobacteraceae bacterium]MDH3880368.1 ABC transporter ATP-binding protein [Desulfobacteraceae bacterium]
MLEIHGISAHYGGVRALDDVSFKLDEKEILALIGGNGAGKTTLLNLISRIIKPSKGNIIFKGKSILSLSPEKIVELGIIQVPEGRHVFGPLTVKENLELGAYRRRGRQNKKKILDDFEYILALFPVLEKRLKQRAETLSGGEQQMLAIGRALMGRPGLLLLDEPSLGLAPLVVQEIISIIEKLRNEGTTILLVEQNARAALKISDRAYVLETGKVRIQGKASELMENEAVKKAYLG